MAGTQQVTKNLITLKGSAELVKEYLNYGVNSILYQRGIYPADTFKTEEHFGITILMSTDKQIQTFLVNVLGQIEKWLIEKKVEKITVVINDIKSKETLEKWDFRVQYDMGSSVSGGEETGKKDLKAIQKEIRDVLRQITATISFLPLLDQRCSFDIFVQTLQDTDVPQCWDETQPCFIPNSRDVQLRTFSTSLHRMETYVSYKGLWFSAMLKTGGRSLALWPELFDRIISDQNARLFFTSSSLLFSTQSYMNG